MQKEFFNLSDGICLYTTETNVSNITNWGWEFANSHSSTTLRFAKGNKMKTVETMFDEFSAALQFPYYFGENWAAFDECIADLNWLSGETYIIVITNSDQLLKGELLDELNTLVECFKEAGKELKQEGKGFLVVFQYGENERSFKAKLKSITADFQEIHL